MKAKKLCVQDLQNYSLQDLSDMAKHFGIKPPLTFINKLANKILATYKEVNTAHFPGHKVPIVWKTAMDNNDIEKIKQLLATKNPSLNFEELFSYALYIAQSNDIVKLFVEDFRVNLSNFSDIFIELLENENYDLLEFLIKHKRMNPAINDNEFYKALDPQNTQEQYLMNLLQDSRKGHVKAISSVKDASAARRRKVKKERDESKEWTRAIDNSDIKHIKLLLTTKDPSINFNQPFIDAVFGDSLQIVKLIGDDPRTDINRFFDLDEESIGDIDPLIFEYINEHPRAKKYRT